MTRKLMLMASAGLLAATLAACGNTITPADPFPDEERIEVTASDARGGGAAITGGTASGSSGQLIEVTIPQQVIDQDVVWFELANAVNVERLIVYDSIAGIEHEAFVSTEAGWFDNPESIGDTPPAAIDTSQITIQPECRGPCVIHATDENIGTVRYVRVVPESGTTASFDFHVFGEAFSDENMGLTKDSAIVFEGAEVGHVIYSEMERWYHVDGPVDTATLTQGLGEGAAMAFKADIYVGNGITEIATLDEANPTFTFDAPTEGVWFHVMSFNETRASAPGYASFTVSAE